MLPTDVRVIVALDPYGRALMKRDMEPVREILLHVESRKDAKPKAVRIEGYEDPIVVQHVEMLLDAKLLVEIAVRQRRSSAHNGYRSDMERTRVHFGA
jgi:hypothetical protein